MTGPRNTVDLAEAKRIIRSYEGRKIVLIPLLQEIQAHYGYVPEEAVALIADAFGILSVEIYGVLTFYAQFYLEPRGEHTIKVCQGTACYILGGRDILDHVSRRLDIVPEETTDDGFFTLETVACLGCCGMGPVVAVDGNLHGNMTVQGVDQILDAFIKPEKVA